MPRKPTLKLNMALTPRIPIFHTKYLSSGQDYEHQLRIFSNDINFTMSSANLVCSYKNIDIAANTAEVTSTIEVSNIIFTMSSANLTFPYENIKVLASTAEASRPADKHDHLRHKFSKSHLSLRKHQKATRPANTQYHLCHRFSEPPLS